MAWSSSSGERELFPWAEVHGAQFPGEFVEWVLVARQTVTSIRYPERLFGREARLQAAVLLYGTIESVITCAGRSGRLVGLSGEQGLLVQGTGEVGEVANRRRLSWKRALHLEVISQHACVPFSHAIISLVSISKPMKSF